MAVRKGDEVLGRRGGRLNAGGVIDFALGISVSQKTLKAAASARQKNGGAESGAVDIAGQTVAVSYTSHNY